MKKILALTLAMLMVLAFAACGGGEETAAPAEVAVEEVAAPAAPAEAPAAAPVEEAAPAGDASGEMAAGDASGEMASGEMAGGMGNQSADYEIELNGETVTAHYEDIDNGDTATKSFTITVNDQTVEGAIDKGVWTATSGDAADQAIVDAVKAVFEAGNPASGEPAA